MEEEQKSKGKKPRLRSMQSLFATSLEAIDELMKDKSMKNAKLADLAIARLNCIQSMMLNRSEEAKAKLRFADVDALTKEVERLRAENDRLRAELHTPVSTSSLSNETLEERLAKLRGSNV